MLIPLSDAECHFSLYRHIAANPAPTTRRFSTHFLGLIDNFVGRYGRASCKTPTHSLRRNDCPANKSKVWIAVERGYEDGQPIFVRSTIIVDKGKNLAGRCHHSAISTSSGTFLKAVHVVNPTIVRRPSNRLLGRDSACVTNIALPDHEKLKIVKILLNK